MGITSKIAAFAGRKLGFYTNKEAFKISEKIGKDLVDFQKNGGIFTKSSVTEIVKKHAPKLKFNLSATREELAENLIKQGAPKELAQQWAYSASDAGAFKYYAQITPKKSVSGIFAPMNDMLPVSFSHELEHYIHGKSKLAKFRIKKVPQGTWNAESIQRDLGAIIGIDEFQPICGLPVHIVDDHSVEHIMKNFKGINSAEDVKAYFTNLARSYVHPQSKGATKNIMALRNVIQDEQRAYTISQDITRYMLNAPQDCKFASGSFADVLKYLDDVLKQEQKIAMTTKTVKGASVAKPAALEEETPFGKCIKGLF